MNNQRVIESLRHSSNWEEYDAYMGRLCGIPECCIKFFVRLDKAGVENAIVMNQLYGEVINPPLDATGGPYVLCPQCRRMRTTKKVPYKKSSRSTRQDFNKFKNSCEELT